MTKVKCPLCTSNNCYTYPTKNTTSKLFNCRNCGCKFTMMSWHKIEEDLEYETNYQ